MEKIKFVVENELPDNAPNYAFAIQDIILLYDTNKNKAIKKAMDFKRTREQFSKVIKIFEEKYSNASEYTDILYDVLNSYEDNKPKQNQYLNKDAFNSETEEKKRIYNIIYNSGLSILDYCYYNEVKVNNFSVYISSRYSRGCKDAIEIKSREDKTLPLIIDLINKINNDEIDYVDYYEITKLNPYYLRNIAKKHNIYTEKLGIFIRSIKAESARINIESELDSKLVINEEEVSKEIKEQAINHLKNIDAPLTAINYNIMVRKLIKSSK